MFLGQKIGCPNHNYSKTRGIVKSSQTADTATKMGARVTSPSKICFLCLVQGSQSGEFPTRGEFCI